MRLNPDLISSEDLSKLQSSLNSFLESIKLPFPPDICISEIISDKPNGRQPSKGPNNFLIYRKAFVKELNRQNLFIPMKSISSSVGKKWKKEPAHVKEEYTRLASEVRQHLNEKNYGSWESYRAKECNFQSALRPAAVMNSIPYYKREKPIISQPKFKDGIVEKRFDETPSITQNFQPIEFFLRDPKELETYFVNNNANLKYDKLEIASCPQSNCDFQESSNILPDQHYNFPTQTPRLTSTHKILHSQFPLEFTPEEEEEEEEEDMQSPVKASYYISQTDTFYDESVFSVPDGILEASLLHAFRSDPLHGVKNIEWIGLR
ncbi:hypothetical protein G9A89_008918 [Geosiphon pyriformis]|nr:hypothetical protein G9A89_008918 [Geosiphon pyriformis]